MDSFEMFGEIMNPNLDSMLPPGEIRRKAFDTALMGLESKGGGGGDDGSAQEEQIEKQYEFDMKNYDYNNLTIDRNYEQQLISNQMQRVHIAEVADYQDKRAAEQWDYAMKVREIKYNSQVAAYNKAEQLYGAQIGLNQRAAGLAYDNAINVNKERQEQLAFSSARSNLGFQEKRKALQYQRQQNQLGIEKGRKLTGIRKEEATLKNQAARATAAFKSQDMFVKKLQAQGKAEARGVSGRSAAKTYQSITAEAGRSAAALRDGVTRADSAYNLSMYGLDVNLQFDESAFMVSENKFHSDIDVLGKNQNLQEQQEAASKLSIMRAYDHTIKKVGHDQFAANLAADAKRMSKPSLMPSIPVPDGVPRARVLDPMVPIYGPEPIEGAAYSGGTSGGGGNAVSGAVGGAMQGFALGAATGIPHLAGIGAVLGGIGGAVGIM